MEVRSDRTYRFGVDCADIWAALGQVDRYQHWWPWLRRMDAEGLVEGDQWQCLIRPPVPYVLNLTVHLVEVQAHERIAAEVTGDIVGDATVSLRSTDQGSEVRLVSALRPRRGPLRAVATLAPWMANFGHDWVLDTGLRQFRRRAL